MRPHSLTAIALTATTPSLFAQQTETIWQNATTTHLAVAATQARSMDAEITDLNNDNINDIVVAVEFGTNVVMLGKADGTFHYKTGLFPTSRLADSEDIAVADFNNDNRPDLAFACEDDQTPELFIQQPDGTFKDLSENLPVMTVGNAILAIDIDNDKDLDIILADAGQTTQPQLPASGAPNVLLINDGKGNFTKDTSGILPQTNGATQDMEAGDLDNDGDLDLVIGNENGNEVWINNNGKFTDMTESLLPDPPAPVETREIDLADIDNDGDLDLFVANVGWRGLDARNMLYINNGSGSFEDVSKTNIPRNLEWTLDVEFADLDNDKDLDIVLAQHDQGGQSKPVRVLINDGTGDYSDKTDQWVPDLELVHAIDVEVADLNKDGTPDIYIANHVTADRLLLSSDK